MFVRDYYVKISMLSADDGGGWLATVPDLPGCTSDGDTIEHALASVDDAIGCWIEAARRLGRDVPEPAKVVQVRA